MSRLRPQSGKIPSDYFQQQRAKQVPNAISFDIPAGPVPLLDGSGYAVVDEASEREASTVMSRLHRKFDSQRTYLATQVSVISVAVPPTGRASPRDISVQADEQVAVQSAIPTFEQWLGVSPRPATRPPSPPRKFKGIRSPRTPRSWKRVIVPASPFAQRVAGSKVRDSPTTGAMFSPVRSLHCQSHWAFLPTSVLKRHPELFRR